MRPDDVRELFRTVLAMLDAPREGLGEERDRSAELEHAKSYDETEAVLTRRARRNARQAEQWRAMDSASMAPEEREQLARSAADLEARAAEELRRASDYGERARLVRAGEPIPRRLRTPAESLDLVDDYRRALAQIYDAIRSFDDLDGGELTAFCAAAKLEDSGEVLREGLTVARIWADQALARLGVTYDDEKRVRFAPFRSPLAGAPLPIDAAESTIEGGATNGV